MARTTTPLRRLWVAPRLTAETVEPVQTGTLCVAPRRTVEPVREAAGGPNRLLHTLPFGDRPGNGDEQRVVGSGVGVDAIQCGMCGVDLADPA